MSRLIDADALRKSFKKCPFFTEVYLYYARQLIDNAPTVEINKWLDPDIDPELALENIRRIVYEQ